MHYKFLFSERLMGKYLRDMRYSWNWFFFPSYMLWNLGYSNGLNFVSFLWLKLRYIILVEVLHRKFTRCPTDNAWDRLLELMINYDVGVNTYTVYKLKKVDLDYFSD